MQDAQDHRSDGRSQRQGGLPVREVRLFALCASLTAHLALALVLAILILEPAPAQIGGDGEEVRLATVSDVQLDSAFAEVDLQAEVPDALGMSQDQMPTFEDLMPVADVDLSALQTGEVKSLGGAGDAIGEGVTGSGAGGVASFFGLEARGNRFAFVVDVSGSMEFEGRMDLLKRELNASIDALLEHTHFTIWTFNSDAYPLTGVRWVDANDPSKERAKRDIRTITSNGATVPDDAIRSVFAMRPRPDAIYFMTDGDFDGRGDGILKMIQELNHRGFRRVPVHCITLVDRSGELSMRRIAQATGGSYRHVSGRNP